MFQERGDNNERCESCQSFGSSNLLRLTTGQKIATLPDIVTEQFDDQFNDIVNGLGTDPDLDSYIPEQCRKCPLLAGIIEALKMALAQKEALERTALETADNITTWLRAQGTPEDKIKQILEDPKRLEEARAEYGKIVEVNLAIGSAAFNQLLPGIERQTAGCPGIIKCISLNRKTVVEVCGSPAAPNGESSEAATVRRTGGDEQDSSESDTSDQ
jgi:hypothetical protein